MRLYSALQGIIDAVKLLLFNCSYNLTKLSLKKINKIKKVLYRFNFWSVKCFFTCLSRGFVTCAPSWSGVTRHKVNHFMKHLIQSIQSFEALFPPSLIDTRYTIDLRFTVHFWIQRRVYGNVNFTSRLLWIYTDINECFMNEAHCSYKSE